MKYIACYRCRDCGKIFPVESLACTEEEVSSIMKWVRNGNRGHFGDINVEVPLFFMHYCDGTETSSIGYVEFSGFKAVSDDGETLEDSMREAERNGRLIELPVGIGEPIWEVIPVDEGHVRELKVESIVIWDDGTYLFNCSDGVYESNFNSRRLGTLMFLTKEEAEAKLKELEDKSDNV